MFRMHLEYAKKSFQNNIVYRFDTLLSVLNTLISIFVYVAIWTSIFNLNGTINGYNLKMVTTHFVISLGLTTIFINMTGELPQKVISGEIAIDLLKPISYKSLLLSKTIGSVLCKLLMQFLPAFVISYFAIGLLLPVSLLNGLLFFISVIFGFLIYYLFDLIISITSFWFNRVFFITQFKNAILTILSGALLPIWFLPGFLKNIIKFTPFDSIYFIPISIYLGKFNNQEILFGLMKQAVWIVVLGVISHFIWNAGIKKLVIQGG